MNKNIRVFLRRLKTMSIRKMLKMIRQTSSVHNKNAAVIFADMLFCALRYNIGYQDYRVFGFAALSKQERETFLTMNKNLQLVRLLNGKESRKSFEDKRLFFKKYSGYIKRGWIDISDKTADELEAFCKDKDAIFVKTPCSFGGQGIGEIKVTPDTSYDSLHSELKKKGQTLVEEKIKQHPKLSAIHPESINTLRIATLKKDGKVHIICRILRMGQGGSVIDNITSGGLYAPVDENGRISHPAFCDIKGEAFTVHPTSRIFLPGYRIPFFEEAVELVRRIAGEENGLGYVGWDVAITPDGPVIVEGNEIPSYEIMQNYLHRNNNSGLLPQIEKILGCSLHY